MSSVSLRSVSKVYSGSRAVDALDLDVAEGEFVVFLGPSGCGKTTTLRMIAGFVEPTEGQIVIGGRDVTSLPPQRRNIGMVFQSYALFPNMTVADNIGFGLRQRRTSRTEIRERVTQLLDLVHLSGRGDDQIDMLSGGQQQRVALARALAPSPQLLLMDEPLGALDVKLREALQIELLRLQRELGVTTILVTHDQHEAMVLADRIVLMAEGRIQQVGAPQSLYYKPASPFVADFIGKSNIFRGRIVPAGSNALAVELADDARVHLPQDRGHRVGDTAEISVRPEHLKLGPPAAADAGLVGRVEQLRFLGNVTHCFVKMPWGQIIMAEQSGRSEGFVTGSSVAVSWEPDDAVLFAPPPAGSR
jgi:ABC-type Fe3+/spermidine/putrescine transport system ATPase subunit